MPVRALKALWKYEASRKPTAAATSSRLKTAFKQKPGLLDVPPEHELMAAFSHIGLNALLK